MSITGERLRTTDYVELETKYGAPNYHPLTW